MCCSNALLVPSGPDIMMGGPFLPRWSVMVPRGRRVCAECCLLCPVRAFPTFLGLELLSSHLERGTSNLTFSLIFKTFLTIPNSSFFHVSFKIGLLGSIKNPGFLLKFHWLYNLGRIDNFYDITFFFSIDVGLLSFFLFFFFNQQNLVIFVSIFHIFCGLYSQYLVFFPIVNDILKKYYILLLFVPELKALCQFWGLDQVTRICAELSYLYCKLISVLWGFLCAGHNGCE